VTEERKGFLFLVTSDVAKARDAFLAAYEAFPTYHNVDEISHRVLTAERIAFYARATPPKRAAVLRNVIGGTLSTYSWGIPTDLLPKLKARAT
jgi:hypothetical protein